MQQSFLQYSPQDHAAAATHYKARVLDPSSFELPSLTPRNLSLPIYVSKVSAGFPSPAEEYVDKRLDTNDYLIDQKDATFL